MRRIMKYIMWRLGIVTDDEGRTYKEARDENGTS